MKMIKFINRERELNSLETLYRKNSSQLIIIYGRRRVGKTELIKKFIKDKPSIYFLSRIIPERENLITLGKNIGDFFNDTTLKMHGFNNWDEVFIYLRDQFQNKRVRHLVLVIDEFPYLVESNKGISSIFQAGWDEYLKQYPIFLILCGSSIGIMEQETLTYKAPLYGRRSAQLLIKPLPFHEVRKFFPKFNFDECLKVYSIVGGIPAYILKITGYNNLETAIKEEIFSPERFLYEEVEFILKEELREPRNYFSILKAIASNCTKVSEIINNTGFEKSALHNYLFTLEDLHIIEKRVPVTERKPQISRKGRYYLKDNFFKFWFNYCFPFINELELGNKLPSIKAYRDGFYHIIAQNYEEVAQEILYSYQDRIFPFHKVGRWWDKNEEIDIVALNDESGEILFGEVKWSNKHVGIDIYKRLKEKAKKVEWGRKDRKEYFCLFSKTGFTPEMKNLAKKENVFLFVKDKIL